LAALFALRGLPYFPLWAALFCIVPGCAGWLTGWFDLGGLLADWLGWLVCWLTAWAGWFDLCG